MMSLNFICSHVIPVKAGIQAAAFLDTRLRGYDGGAININRYHRCHTRAGGYIVFKTNFYDIISYEQTIFRLHFGKQTKRHIVYRYNVRLS